MPKFLARVTLNAEGVRLLRQDKGSGRRAAVTRAVEAAGGKVEAFYFAYGQDDTIIIAEPAIVGSDDMEATDYGEEAPAATAAAAARVGWATTLMSLTKIIAP